jgi:hypothetical protein
MIESVYINVIHSVHLNTVKVSNLYKVDKKIILLFTRKFNYQHSILIH